MDSFNQLCTISTTITTLSWPHARRDCPLLWQPSIITPSPCTSCYCFVCDIPFHLCDHPSFHEMADGRCEDWTQLKRRRSALANTWLDIPNLVNLLVNLSVDESFLRQEKNILSSQNNTDAIIIQGSASVSNQQVVSTQIDLNTNTPHLNDKKDVKAHSPTTVINTVPVSRTIIDSK